jgi:2-dehydro-3-deoxyphosphogluconate aldolase / (4S)-4-hydroxy-2-oxoglutarate aldolase
MDNDDFFATHLAHKPVMAIFRGNPPDATVALCDAAWDAGIDLIEIPVQTPDALPSLAAAISSGRERGKSVGAGTVTDTTQLAEVIDMGAAFTVAPGMDPEIIAHSARAAIPHLPGVSTSTEISIARKHGLTWLKAFPAAHLGPAWITAQLAPFPRVKFVATGGVSARNAADFLAAGCGAVALGSAFADPGLLESLDRVLSEGVAGEDRAR